MNNTAAMVAIQRRALTAISELKDLDDPLAIVNAALMAGEQCNDAQKQCENFILRTIDDKEWAIILHPMLKKALLCSMDLLLAKSMGMVEGSTNSRNAAIFDSSFIFSPLMSRAEHSLIKQDLPALLEQVVPELAHYCVKFLTNEQNAVQELRVALEHELTRVLATNATFCAWCDIDLITNAVIQLRADFKSFSLQIADDIILITCDCVGDLLEERKQSGSEIDRCKYKTISSVNDSLNEASDQGYLVLPTLEYLNATVRDQLNNYLNAVQRMQHDFQIFIRANHAERLLIKLFNQKFQDSFFKATKGCSLQQYAAYSRQSHMTMSVYDRAALCKSNIMINDSYIRHVNKFSEKFAKKLFSVYLQQAHGAEIQQYQEGLEHQVELYRVIKQFKHILLADQTITQHLRWPINIRAINNKPSSTASKLKF